MFKVYNEKWPSIFLFNTFLYIGLKISNIQTWILGTQKCFLNKLKKKSLWSTSCILLLLLYFISCLQQRISFGIKTKYIPCNYIDHVPTIPVTCREQMRERWNKRTAGSLKSYLRYYNALTLGGPKNDSSESSPVISLTCSLHVYHIASSFLYTTVISTFSCVTFLNSLHTCM